MSAVLFLGDFNVDLIMDGLEAAPAPDRETGCASFTMVMGASTCIAATAFSRLGGFATVCSLSGDDEFGAFMRSRLAEAGVLTDLVGRHAAVGTGVTVNLVREGRRTQVTYPGAMGLFAAGDVPPVFTRELAHVHVSGVYQLAGLRPGLSDLLGRAAAAGATTSLDCQWDPAEKWAGIDQWLPRVDWLFVNEEEARSMTGAADASAALTALAARTRCPVVKAGAEGAWVMVDGVPVRVTARQVTVVDSIGAGDTFDASFLFALLDKGMSLQDAARFANAAAARSCTFRGGTEAASTFQDVLTFMETP
jgi:sugar/nucleoside kinase (ribokinase family)